MSHLPPLLHWKISIHALREEGDAAAAAASASYSHFYPRPPRGGRRARSRAASVCRRFLSTPSARRATYLDLRYFCFFAISIHALREEGDRGRADTALLRPISIHALREEGDLEYTCFIAARAAFLSTPSARRATPEPLLDYPVKIFLSTPSARRATGLPPSGQRLLQISIHALREEGDPLASASNNCFGIFLSTPSARRATSVKP